MRRLAAAFSRAKLKTSTSIREVIATLNRMEADAVIERHAIGGAVGATFYLEPVATLDVDVFVALKPNHSLISLE